MLYARPSFKVVVPIPDWESLELVIVKTLIFCFSLIFEVTFILRNVAINLASLLVPNPLIITFWDPALKLNLSADKDSVVPSDLIKI